MDTLDASYISHFLDRVGVKCKTPALASFMCTWNANSTTSMKARRVWSQMSARGMPRRNSTRWWSLWECLKVVFEEKHHVNSFLESNDDFAEVSRKKVLDSIQQSSLQIRVEQAAMMGMEKFVKVTYTLEGDGALLFIAFQRLEELRQFIDAQNFGTLLVQRLSPLNVVEQQRWYLYGLRECLMPAFQYYLETSANDAIVSVPSEYFKQRSCSTHELSRYRGQLLQMLRSRRASAAGRQSSLV